MATTASKRKPAPSRASASKSRAGTARRAPNKSTGRRPAQRKGAQTRKPVRPAKNSPAQNPNSARGVLLLGLSLVTFLLWLLKDSNDILKSIGGFASALLGRMAFVLPVLLLWLSVRAFKASADGDDSARKLVMPCIFTLLVLTAAEGFNIASVSEKYLERVRTYPAFLSAAFKARQGGGAVGAILGYPLEAVLKRWGVLIVVLIVNTVMLQLDGIISVEKLGKGMFVFGQRAGSVIGGATGKIGSKVSDKVKQICEERRVTREELYNARAARKNGTDSGAGYTRVTRIKEVGDIFEVPTVAGTGKQKKTFETAKAQPEDTFGADYDILEEIKKDDPQKRNDRYVKDALKNHARRAPAGAANQESGAGRNFAEKPGHTPEKHEYVPEKREYTPEKHEYVPEKPPKAAPAEVPEDNYVSLTNQTKAPQRPKPSFTDAEEKPIIKQNSEQGRPSDTTYVAPGTAVKTESKPEPKAAFAPPKADDAAACAVYNYPPMDIMESGGESHSADREEEVNRQRAEVLVKTLQNFSIPVRLTGVSPGPAVTRFEILPAPGIKVSKVASYADDIAMALAAVSVRIEAPIPGKNAVGVEVPNVHKEIVHLRDVLESNEARNNKKRLMVGLGKDNSGKFIVADLASMPHVLIAGQTGSGKSVCINAIIISIIYRATPDEVKMILVDPKMVELNVYNSIPHLLVPVVTDPKKAAGALEWAVGEMSRRYKVFAERGAKNIESYNAKLEPDEKRMPQIVIIVDELADLMMTSPREVEDSINRLAQLARAAGMHLVIATQRPSVDVITGLIKANIPTRIAFTVASGVDSRTILDCYGAEKLLGRGDMLYLPQDRNKPMRLQGAWVSEEEVQAVVDHVSGADTEYDADMIEHMENAALSDAEKKDKHDEEVSSDTDSLFEEALRCVVDAGQASISMLQRKLRIGYARAGRLVDEMAQRGYVSSSEGSKTREVLLTREQLNQIFSDSKE